MRYKLGPIGLAVAAVLLIVAVACGSDAATPPSNASIPPTPNVQATITALAQGGIQVRDPSPTAVPAQDQAVALEFEAGHRAIATTWDGFHSDLDVWREGLVACTPSSVRTALGGFAGRFSSITESARSLPREAVIRNLADVLIQATEQEEAALRLLRDNWQGASATNIASASVDGSEKANSEASENGSEDQNPVAKTSLFEGVEIARSSATTLRKRVADAIIDRAKNTTTKGLSELDAFVTGHRDLESNWNVFHQNYDFLRSQLGVLTSEEKLARLSVLVDQFRVIVASVQTLPITDDTREVSQIIIQAVQDEDLALRKLRGAAQGSLAASSAIPANDSESTADEPDASEDNGDTSDGDIATNDVTSDSIEPTLFDPFDVQLVASNTARLQANERLDKVLDFLSTEVEESVTEFTNQHEKLNRNWDSFHKDYDEWRRTEGGCNRSDVSESLGAFTARFSIIASDVRDLPAATVLRPMGELLVEAAEREERALRNLRDTWQPYVPEVFQPLDRERNTANKLRRQVSVGIEELFERFGITP